LRAIIGTRLYVGHWRKRHFYGLISQMSAAPNVLVIGLLVYPGCLRSSAVAPLDVFKVANSVAARRPHAQRVQFEGLWVGARGGGATTVNGLTFHVRRLDQVRLDALIVPGIDHDSSADLAAALEQLAPEQAVLRQFADSGRLLAASCSSVCLLASAGLLDAKRCTTSWWLAPYFHEHFPRAILDVDQLVVQDGNLLSGGGGTSYLDLSLRLVGHFGGDALRQMTAKLLVTDASRSSQAPYVAAALLEGDGHAVIERARRWLNERLDQPWSMAQLALYCNSSQRTLLRRFQEALGLSPIQYAQQLRVERAKALLESTLLSVDEITHRCGYEDVSTFSKVFKRWAQVTPREYRVRFGLRQ
jgi:transcriptional regulator GlxA family with amidase domain